MIWIGEKLIIQQQNSYGIFIINSVQDKNFLNSFVNIEKKQCKQVLKLSIRLSFLKMRNLEKYKNNLRFGGFRKRKVIRIRQRKGQWRGLGRKGCKFMQKYNVCKNRRCMYAHRDEEFVNWYQIDPDFREKPCKYGKKCELLSCKFYHFVSEKRESILKEKLLDIQEDKSEQLQVYRTKRGGGMDFSKIIPFLSKLNLDQVKSIASATLDCLSYYEEFPIKPLSKSKQWHHLSINLLKTKSIFVGCGYESLVQLWKDVSIVTFKSKAFSYLRNSIKNQLSFEINRFQVVPFVCEEIINRKPHNLKVKIISINKKLSSLQQIFNSIKQTKPSIKRLDLDIQELIGPTDIDVLEREFSKLLSNFKQLKALSLRLQFDYLDGSKYEKDLVDIILDNLKQFQDAIVQGKFYLKVNIFGISMEIQKNRIVFLAETIRNKSVVNQKKLVERLNHSQMQSYFMQKFVKQFSSGNIKEFFVDLSGIYGVAKSIDDRLTAKDAYTKGIPELLKVLNYSLETLNPGTLDRVEIQFFQFRFSFENSKQKNISKYSFNYGFRLMKQNKPILNFDEMFQFGLLLRSRLRIIQSYGLYEGSLFEEIKTKHQYEEEDQEMEIFYFKDERNNAKKFLALITDHFKQIHRINFFNLDFWKLLKISTDQKRIFDLQFKNKIPPYEYQPMRQKMYLAYHLAKRKMVSIIQAIKIVQVRNPKFMLREEIISDILRLQELYPDPDQKFYIPDENDSNPPEYQWGEDFEQQPQAPLNVDETEW